jgi:energy-coupling factor transport system permease protein
MINTWAWIIWLGAVLVGLWSTRNPVYLGIIFIGLILVWRLLTTAIEKVDPAERQRFPFSPRRISLIIIIFSAVFNGLISQFGETVLFTLPAWIPYLGGPFTLEGLVFGALNGLVLSGILIAFIVINLALPVHSLVRLIPRAFYPVAVVTSIAITFMPNTIQQFELIREAQAIRGHRVRGIRDWIPLIMPLLIGGLEKAMGLAEAMTARGFAGQESSESNRNLRICQVVGLVLIFSGWLLQSFSTRDTLGIAILMLGLGLVLFSLWKIGRRASRSVYKREKWTGYDFLVIVFSLIVTVIYWLPLVNIDRSTLFYNPYPFLTSPAINPSILFATFGLIAPGIFYGFQGIPNKIFKKPASENDHF